MKIFGLVILPEQEYYEMRAGYDSAHQIEMDHLHDEMAEADFQHDREIQKLSNTIREQRKAIEALSEIEAKYKQLTARDEKGRFVKRAGA